MNPQTRVQASENPDASPHPQSTPHRTLHPYQPHRFAQSGAEKRLDQLYHAKKPPHTRQDFHGMTAAQCHAQLLDLLATYRAQHVRTALLVHGVGAGILKDTVHQALHDDMTVLGFCQAPPSMGGMGATLVLFKKHKE